ncbi:IS3 family transposase [Candidatus Palauibacter sp.]|uniref:IS3 family transposase n=1 Tax=Candidatus Palauibacter sp. TaxID=3101350 RepID=UPI003AF23B8F
MAARAGRYPPEYRERLVELARAGRSPGSLAREFEPSEQTIRNWVRRAELDEGERSDGLTTETRQEVSRLKRENKRLRMERDILKKAGGLVRAGERLDPRRGYAFMKAHRAEFPLAAMCRVLGLSSSGYYDWLKRPPSARARRDAQLEARIGSIWTGSGETYGRPRIHAALRAEGERVGQKRVGRLMRGLGIEGATRRRFKTATTKRDVTARPAPDLVNRDFSASGPDQLWVADITYVPTWAGWLYLAVVLDVWSRRVVGWAMATHMRTELVEAALAMALARRRPEGRVVHHSDRGSQYTSLAFGERCRESGIAQSMGSVGDAYDNAMCESFFATLECELIWRRSFRTASEARREVFGFIEGFYNTRRLHSALGYESPASYERNHAA